MCTQFKPKDKADRMKNCGTCEHFDGNKCEEESEILKKEARKCLAIKN
jgi:hypothetical protein